jgi:4-hydroxy-2-oxoglutarate aldolase
MQMIRTVKPSSRCCGSALTLYPSLAIGAWSGARVRECSAHSTVAIGAFRTRENEAALDWQNRIGRAAARSSPPARHTRFEYAMDLNGYYGGPPRLPLTPAGPEAKREIEEAFADLKS